MSVADSGRETVFSPPGHPVWGHYFQYRSDPLGFFTKCAREYGDAVHLRFGPVHVYLLNRPEFTKSVLVDRSQYFVKGLTVRTNWANRLMLGNGIFLSEADEWLRQRRVIQPAFHPRECSTYAQRIVDQAIEHISTWSEGDVRDVHQESGRLVLNIVCGTLFNFAQDDAAMLSQALIPAVESYHNLAGIRLLLPEWVPTLDKVRFGRAVRRLDQVLRELVQLRRNTKDGVKDLLSRLLESEDLTASGYGWDRQLRDQIVTLALASYETSALVLTWCFQLLGQHPEAERRVMEEIRATLRGRTPTFSDLSTLKFIDAVVLESLRLYPPVWRFAREAIDRVDFEGISIPKGAQVILSPWVTHHDPRFFDDPWTFNPDRWLQGPTSTCPRYAYFPFGAGPRVCPGEPFVHMEAVLTLATIMQRFKLVPQTADSVALHPGFTLRPKYGVQMVVKER